MIDRALRNRTWILAASVVLMAVTAPGLFRLQIDNSAEGFFLDESEVLSAYRTFVHDFGSDRGARIVLRGTRLWRADFLAWMAALEQRLPELPGILGAGGLYWHHRHDFDDWPPSEPDDFRRRVLGDPVDIGTGLVSASGEVITILISFDDVSALQRRQTLAEIESLLQREAPAGVETAVVGIPVLFRSVDESILKWAFAFFPWLVVAAVLALWLAFRNLAHVLIPLLLVTVVETAVLGGMGLVGVSLDMIVLLIIPLVFIVVLATAVHVLFRFRHHLSQGKEAETAVRRTYLEKAWPVLWTGLTTMVGFGSLMSSDVPPVFRLGLWTALGIFLMLLSSFTLLPVLLVYPGKGPGFLTVSRFERLTRRAGRSWTTRALRRHRLVEGAFAVSAVICCLGVSRLEVQHSVLDYFHPSDPERVELARLEESGIAPVAADLVLTDRGSTPRFRDPAELRRVGDLARALRQAPAVVGAVSPVDLLASKLGERVSEAQEREDSSELWQEALDLVLADFNTERMMASLWTSDGTRVRISILVPFLGFRELAPMLDRARQLGSRLLPGVEFEETGQFLLLARTQSDLLPTMLWSFTLTFVLIGLILFGLMPSLRLWAAAMVANLWPVLLMLGIMGWAGISLDGTTVMVSAVALGLAVDDTLHTLGYYRERIIPGDPEGRVIRCLEKAAGSHIMTSLLLTAGFGICSLSGFLPISRFGGLAATAILAALAADLFLFPVLLLRVSRGSDDRPAQQG